MSEWDWRRLDALATLKMGQSPSGQFVEELEDGIPFLQGNAEFGEHFPTATFQCGDAPRRCQKGDSLISVRAPVGAINRSDREYGIGRGLAAITFARIYSSYGHHALLEHARGLHRVSQGTTFLAIGRPDLAALKIPHPPVGEQRRIAEILDTIDETIQATERVIVKHQQIRSGLAADLLTQAVERFDGGNRNPMTYEAHSPEWRKCQLGDIGTIVGGGTPARDNARCWDGLIPWLTPGELTSSNEKFVFETDEKISFRGLAESGARWVPAGSLLMTSRASIGFCALAGTPMTTNQGFKNLIPRTDVDSSYLFHLGQTLQREMIRRASGTTFLEISSREFGRIEIRMPPLGEQRRIARILDSADDAIRAHEVERDKLRALRSGLAADLLSGRVRTVAA
ncbi:MAG: restriction endonuclease subunit S [Acidimicrobiaceae bacterium]|nr:restriction endonuclease subunit S [Acidimicrobiaceae bacterium]